MPEAVSSNCPSQWSIPQNNSQGELVITSHHKEHIDGSQSQAIIKAGIQALRILDRSEEEFQHDFEDIGLGKISFILEEDMFELAAPIDVPDGTNNQEEVEVFRVLRWDTKWVYHSSEPPCQNPDCAGYTSDRLPTNESWGTFVEDDMNGLESKSCNPECHLSMLLNDPADSKEERNNYIPDRPHSRWISGIYSYRHDLGTIRYDSRDMSEINVDVGTSEGAERGRAIRTEEIMRWLGGLES